MEGHLIESDGYKYYMKGGGTPLIILHGLMGGLSNFDGVSSYFPTKGYKVIIPELPLYNLPILKTNVKDFAKRGILPKIGEYLQKPKDWAVSAISHPTYFTVKAGVVRDTIFEYAAKHKLDPNKVKFADAVKDKEIVNLVNNRYSASVSPSDIALTSIRRGNPNAMVSQLSTSLFALLSFVQRATGTIGQRIMKREARQSMKRINKAMGRSNKDLEPSVMETTAHFFIAELMYQMWKVQVSNQISKGFRNEEVDAKTSEQIVGEALRNTFSSMIGVGGIQAYVGGQLAGVADGGGGLASQNPTFDYIFRDFGEGFSGAVEAGSIEEKLLASAPALGAVPGVGQISNFTRPLQKDVLYSIDKEETKTQVRRDLTNLFDTSNWQRATQVADDYYKLKKGTETITGSALLEYMSEEEYSQEVFRALIGERTFGGSRKIEYGNPEARNTRWDNKLKYYANIKSLSPREFEILLDWAERSGGPSLRNDYERARDKDLDKIIQEALRARERAIENREIDGFGKDFDNSFNDLFSS